MKLEEALLWHLKIFKPKKKKKKIPINMFVNDFAKGITIDLCYDNLKIVKAVVVA